MNIDDLVSPTTRRIVAQAGLHKIAGAMLGTPEVSLKEAAAVLGVKAFMRRKEARSIADGIAAYATLTNVKIADNAMLQAMLQRAVMPAMSGAAIAAVPHLLNDDPNKGSILTPMAMGGVMGGLGGVLHKMNKLPPELSAQVAREIAP